MDVPAGGDVILAGVSNGEAGALDVPAGSYDADVALAGTDTVAIGPASLNLTEGTNTIVYAYGTADSGYDFLIQSSTGLHSAPEEVPAGIAGLADSPTFPVWVVGLMLLGAAAITAPVVARQRH